MVFLFGFLLTMGGLGLLIAGELPWLGGKKIPARTGRLVGAILIMFFPLVLLVRFVVLKFEADYDIDAGACYWSVAALCVLVATIMLIRGLPSSARMAARSGPAVPFEGTETPWEQPPAGDTLRPPAPGETTGRRRKPKPAPKQHNPFDFS